MMAIVEYVKAGYTYTGVLKTKTAKTSYDPKLGNKEPPPPFFNIFFYGWGRGGHSRTIIEKV